MSVTGERDGEPMKSGIALADVIAGKDAAAAVLAALVGRYRGAERRIVISLVDSARAALVNVAQNVLVSGAPAKRWGNAHANLVPYQLFRARDRHVVVAVGSDAQWVACATALGLERMANDQELRTNAGRLVRRAKVADALAVRIANADSADILRLLEAAGVPCGVVKPVHEALADAISPSPRTGMPSPTGGSVRRPPPRLDEHGKSVRTRGWGAFTEA
jgi:crotonobetainyl-CoA:carnitine CoA-transferase CaiB-like acyl-CoA transferase